MSDSPFAVETITITQLVKQINDLLISMNCCKYDAVKFLEKSIDMMRDASKEGKEFQASEIFIDRRLYHGKTEYEDYRQDCKILIECLELFKLYFDMSESTPLLFDPKNRYKVDQLNIVIVLMNE